MDMYTGLSILSGALILVGFASYAYSCWRGNTIPTKSTWLVFALLDTIILSGLIVEGLEQGKNLVNGQILASAFVGWASFALACQFGERGWPLKERLCLAGACLALVAWAVSGSATFGVVASLIVTALGFTPMVVTTIKDPTTEDPYTWMIYAISCFAAIGAIREWTVAEGSQVIVFGIVEVAMAAITWRHKVRQWFL